LKGLLNNNQLKIIALITMTIDHIGVILFPNLKILRIIGRLAFPIFAYMISEGAKYTKNRPKYLLTISLTALICQAVYYFTEKSLDQCILVTFTMSIVLIYSLDYKFLSLPAILTAFFLTEFLNIDYGFCGIMMPVILYIADEKRKKLLCGAIMLILLSLSLGGVQWYSLFAIPLLALYNEKRGKLNLKYLFYIYYPLHLAAIYLISLI
jgi:hypothetical protein